MRKFLLIALATLPLLILFLVVKSVFVEPPEDWEEQVRTLALTTYEQAARDDRAAVFDQLDSSLMFNELSKSIGRTQVFNNGRAIKKMFVDSALEATDGYEATPEIYKVIAEQEGKHMDVIFKVFDDEGDYDYQNWEWGFTGGRYKLYDVGDWAYGASFCELLYAEDDPVRGREIEKYESALEPFLESDDQAESIRQLEVVDYPLLPPGMSIDAKTTLGNLYLAAGEFEKATRLFDEVSKLPEQWGVVWSKARSLEGLERFGEIEAAMQPYLDNVPGDVQALQFIADSHLSAGTTNKAAAVYADLLDAEPQSASVLWSWLLCQSESLTAADPVALEQVATRIRSASKESEMLERLAYRAEYHEMPALFPVLSRIAGEAFPEHSVGNMITGVQRRQDGEYAKAAPYFLKAYHASPEDAREDPHAAHLWAIDETEGPEAALRQSPDTGAAYAQLEEYYYYEEGDIETWRKLVAIVTKKEPTADYSRLAQADLAMYDEAWKKALGLYQNVQASASYEDDSARSLDANIVECRLRTGEGLAAVRESKNLFAGVLSARDVYNEAEDWDALEALLSEFLGTEGLDENQPTVSREMRKGGMSANLVYRFWSDLFFHQQKWKRSMALAEGAPEDPEGYLGWEPSRTYECYVEMGQFDEAQNLVESEELTIGYQVYLHVRQDKSAKAIQVIETHFEEGGSIYALLSPDGLLAALKKPPYIAALRKAESPLLGLLESDADE